MMYDINMIAIVSIVMAGLALSLGAERTRLAARTDDEL